MVRLSIIALLAFFLQIQSLHAQIFSGTSPSIQWNQINTQQFRIIYPKGIDSVANKVATILHYTGPFTLQSIGDKTKKINIVLRNGGLVSNGYVSLAPFRSEFYLSPPQNAFMLGSIPWPDMLSAHEYRHVQQDANFDTGLSHILRVIFGQEGQILANAGAVPDWFYEGDAVYMESKLSRQGRGALPWFYKDFRALWASGKNYSWAKLRNGSYKDFVPDKYILGYMMVAYGREKFGDDFWKNVTGNAAAYKSLFYPMQSAIKKYSGENYSTFRENALRFFKDQFRDSVSASETGFYINEYRPQFTENGEGLVYLSESVKKISAFYSIQNGRVRKIRTDDNMTDDYFNLQGNKIIYASAKTDIRWGYKQYSEIQILDIVSGRQKTLTKRTKYFSPALNQSQSKIVAVHVEPNSTTSLHLLDAKNGKILKKVHLPDILNFSYPIFYGDTVFCGVSDKDGKNSILLFNSMTNQYEYLLPFSGNVIGWPFIQNDTLYFSYSYKTNDCLFAVTLQDKKIWQIILPQKGIGAYQFSANNDSAAITTFTDQGFRIFRFPKSELTFKEIPANKLVFITSSFGITEINGKNSNLLLSVGDTTFEKRKYSPLTSPFNFHSLEPSVNDPEYSLSLLGENVLNTLTSQVSFTYNRSDRSKQIGAGITYGRWFPVMSIGMDYHFDRKIFRGADSVISYNSLEPYAGFYIPLNFSKGRSLTSLNFGSNFKLSSNTFQKSTQKKFKDFSYSYLSNYISFANQSRQATAQVQPRFAQTLFLSYKYPLSNVSGFQYTGKLHIYLPGISQTHSLNFVLAYSKRDTLYQINFSNSFPFSRGYIATNNQILRGLQINYELPLWYPEYGIANIVYFSRIRGNFFYDYSEDQSTVSNTIYRRHFRSAGAEIYFDTRWWNQTPVSFGVRYSYLLDRGVTTGNGSQWQFIMPINIFNK